MAEASSSKVKIRFSSLTFLVFPIDLCFRHRIMNEQFYLLYRNLLGWTQKENKKITLFHRKLTLTDWFEIQK